VSGHRPRDRRPPLTRTAEKRPAPTPSCFTPALRPTHSRFFRCGQARECLPTSTPLTGGQLARSVVRGGPPGRQRRCSGSLTFAEPDDVRELADGQVSLAAGLRDPARAGGHSSGSVVFGLAGAEEPLCLGDLLFAGSIGGSDLPGGSMAQMESSLREVVPRWTTRRRCIPARPVTSIGRERGTNPYFAWICSDDDSLSGFSGTAACPAGRRASRPRQLRATFELHGFGRAGDPRPSSRWTRCCARARSTRGVRAAPAARRPDEADAGLGLHFDLTVPFSRATCWRTPASSDFPFRRYQIQKVWRGERRRRAATGSSPRPTSMLWPATRSVPLRTSHRARDGQALASISFPFRP